MYCERACVLHEGSLIPFDTVDEAYDFYQAQMHTQTPTVEQ